MPSESGPLPESFNPESLATIPFDIQDFCNAHAAPLLEAYKNHSSATFPDFSLPHLEEVLHLDLFKQAIDLVKEGKAELGTLVNLPPDAQGHVSSLRVEQDPAGHYSAVLDAYKSSDEDNQLHTTISYTPDFNELDRLEVHTLDMSDTGLTRYSTDFRIEKNEHFEGTHVDFDSKGTNARDYNFHVFKADGQRVPDANFRSL